jgi:hypothetical protein
MAFFSSFTAFFALYQLFFKNLMLDFQNINVVLSLLVQILVSLFKSNLLHENRFQ